MQLIPLFAAVITAACATTPVARATREPLEIELPEAGSDKIIKASDFRGRVVLVDIWATWCVPCLESMPFYAELFRRYEKKGLIILAVSVDERDEDVARFIDAHGLPFPVLRDPKGTLPSKLDLRVMPTAFLLDRQGRIIHVRPGFVAQDKEEVESVIRRSVE